MSHTRTVPKASRERTQSSVDVESYKKKASLLDITKFIVYSSVFSFQVQISASPTL